MPTLYRPKKPRKRVKKLDEDKSLPSYNSKLWQNLRMNQLMNQPLCENCLKDNITTIASEVHHIKPWLSGFDNQEKWYLFTDENNLMSVCNRCHKLIHAAMKKRSSMSHRRSPNNE